MFLAILLFFNNSENFVFNLTRFNVTHNSTSGDNGSISKSGNIDRHFEKFIFSLKKRDFYIIINSSSDKQKMLFSSISFSAHLPSLEYQPHVYDHVTLLQKFKLNVFPHGAIILVFFFN